MLEAVVQGYKSAILKQDDYNALCQCETLQDVKMYLQTNTCYGDPPFLQDVAQLDAATIRDKAQEKLVKEFNELREWSDPPLSTFLDYITYDYMITNVLKLIQGARNNRETTELLRRMHPLGISEGIGAMAADCGTIDGMYSFLSVFFKTKKTPTNLTSPHHSYIRDNDYFGTTDYEVLPTQTRES